ncbi:MAG TPA: GHKL domain-containing protein [Clostridiales bacterium]|nr:GHKL domain-containing protein [Clostridiales bacterium]
MLIYLQNILLIVIEIFCCKIFYETFGKKRYEGWINLIQMALLSGCTLLVVYSLRSNLIARQIAMITVFSFFMFWHIKLNIQKSIILAFLFEGLLLAVDYVAFSINSKLLSNNDMIEEPYYMESVLVALLSKTLLFLCILFIRRQFWKKPMEMLADTEWIRFLFFPVFTIIIISAMLSAFRHVETSGQANILFISAFGMVGINVVVFYLINDIIKREIKLHENRMFQMQVKSQANMYRSISENFDNQKQKTHEFKNQITCIESLLAKKQYLELEEYVQKIYGNLNKELDAVDTNNVIVNAILNTKYQEAVEKGIVFVFKINDLLEVQVSDEDMITILSNLLDNAIEACEKCTDNKIIKLKIIKENDALVISVKNTFNHEIHYVDGEIRTTKVSKPEEHGVGIKNVIRIIEKYGGAYAIQEQNKEFLFSIIIFSRKEDLLV